MSMNFLRGEVANFISSITGQGLILPEKLGHGLDLPDAFGLGLDKLFARMAKTNKNATVVLDNLRSGGKF